MSATVDQILKVENEIQELRQRLREKEDLLKSLKRSYDLSQQLLVQNGEPLEDGAQKVTQGPLPKWAIERYSRQILLREIGVPGQAKICAAKVLIVGAGGLGCPAAMYLAGAGVGEIGIVDYDSVEITNIHRQLLHREQDTNVNKAESAARAIRSINSRIIVTPYKVQLDSTNALSIASKYDMVLDCTDNAPTRYLLSDLCVLAKLPLISGSALKLEGQLTVYCYRSENAAENGTIYRGPCYRCVFATPPSPDAMGSCSQHGVAGPVPGVIGTLQAMEALKLIIGHPSRNLLVERMLIMDVDDMSCKVVQLRPRNPMCAACSDTPTITHLIDYEVFCHTLAKEKELDLKILPPNNRISAEDFSKLLQEDHNTLLIDVRAEPEFHMCHIDGADNCPIDEVERKIEELVDRVEKSSGPVVFICRRGNDSQIAAKMLLQKLPEGHRGKVKDMVGGLHAWAKDVDPGFPVY